MAVLRLLSDTPMPAGTVKALWRWPIAGMGGERLKSTRMDSRGMAGDRQHLVCGPDGPLTPAELPGLARWHAAYPFNPHGAIVTEKPPPYPVVSAPDGRSWRWGDPRLALALERELGHGMELMRDPGSRRGLVVATAQPDGDPSVAGVNLQLALDLPTAGGWSGRELRFAEGVRLRLIASRGDGPGIEARVITAGRIALGEAVVLG
jgi:MOSC N-terminal beta barrel domain